LIFAFQRKELGLPATAVIYLCPQSLFKFHPAFDVALKNILEMDNTGHLVLLSGRNKQWNLLLQKRFEATVGREVLQRIHFLPRRPHEALLQLMQ
jgi:protein O-GlcNAc transferase